MSDQSRWRRVFREDIPHVCKKRMRAQELFHALRLPEDAWTVLRVDGRSFTRLTETGFEKPFDRRFQQWMRHTAQALLEELQGVYAYTESDEISVLFPPSWVLFDREVEKLVSISAAIVSATLWPNQDAAFASIIAGIRRVIAELTQRSQLQPPLSQSQIWNVPYLRNPHFTGREELLDQLEQHLSSGDQEDSGNSRRAALTQAQAIKGLGGIGKTQIAVEYAYRSRDLGRYLHILWINAATEETIIASLREIAELLPSFPTKDETDQRQLVKEIKRWLEQCEHQWLLIFDNADDVLLIQEYLPQWCNGSTLITTRAHAVGSLAHSIEVDMMGTIEGVGLLLHRAWGGRTH